MRIFVATFPFGMCSEEPVQLLESTGWEIVYNSLGRRLKSGEVVNFIENCDAAIAGTEPYDRKTIESAKKLKVISRVGIGLDNVDFQACVDNNVVVTYTPDAPSDGVADLVISQIINLIRGIHISDNEIRNGLWNRVLGKTVSECNIGILGTGRIGKKVIKRLFPFDTNIYACDLEPNLEFGKKYNVQYIDKIELFKTCDLVSIHIPMNKNNYHCVGFSEMGSMKEGSYIINTSRGLVIDEDALVSLLLNEHLGGAALDVFSKEPYEGPFISMKNIILTAHIGASARKSRYLMEIGATQDCIKVLKGEKPNNQVFYIDD